MSDAISKMRRWSCATGLHFALHFSRKQGVMNELVGRIRSEFLEMPGLRLTVTQASRLWGLDEGSFATRHRPAVVGRKDRLEDERQPAEQRLLGADSPVEHDVDGGATLSERPGARALEVPARGDRESVRITRVDDLELPLQCVR